MKFRDPALSIWGEALSLLEQADTLHRQFFQIEHRSDSGPTWAPPVDVLATDRELIIIVALPGVAAEQLDVVLGDGVVVVRGQRAMPACTRAAAIYRLEIPYGRFERRIELPSPRFQLAQRALQDGCLVLTFNKLG